MIGVTLRSAEPADFQPLTALYQRSVLNNPRGFIQDFSYHGSLVERITAWRERGGDVIVAYFGGVLTGLGALAPHDAGRVELCKLHVDPGHLSRGIGRALCEALIASARRSGFCDLVLHVTVTQERAIGLYESLGFVEHRREPFETVVYGERVVFDTLHMTLPLKDSALESAHPASKAAFPGNS